MADDMTLGAVCAGGLLALGATLDFLYSAKEKAQFRLRLEARLYRFSYVTPRTFGREEMTFAIGLLEKVFGDRFWSWHRWISVSLTSLIAFAGGFLFVGPRLMPRHLWATRADWAQGTENYLTVPTTLMVVTIGTALSVSLSLWLSSFALRVRGGTSFVGVLFLLAVHVILFAVWKPLSDVVQDITAFVISTSFSEYISENREIKEVDTIPILTSLRLTWVVWWHYVQTAWEQGHFLELLVKLHTMYLHAVSSPTSERLFPSVAAQFSAQLVSVFAGSLRLLLSAWFVIAIFYVRVLRPLIIRAWSTFIQPEKAFFSVPLGMLAALILFVDNYSRIYAAVARTFAW